MFSRCSWASPNQEIRRVRLKLIPIMLHFLPDKTHQSPCATPRMDDIWETLERLLKCKSQVDAIKIIKQQSLLSFELCHGHVSMRVSSLEICCWIRRLMEALPVELSVLGQFYFVQQCCKKSLLNQKKHLSTYLGFFIIAIAVPISSFLIQVR